MAIPVIMPKQGQSVKSCIITQWLRKQGEKVSKGEILCSYETDKAAFDLESPADGTILAIFFNEGSEVPVLKNIAVIGEPGEMADSFHQGPGVPEQVAEKKAAGEPETLTAKKERTKLHAAAITDLKIRISPRAKLLADNNNIRYEGISGSGPNRRIITADIEKAMKNKMESSGNAEQKEPEYSDAPLSNVRRIIAKAMHASLQNSAQLTHHMSADVRKLLDTRRRIKDKVTPRPVKDDITLNDMVCWCVIRSLKKFPAANSHFLGNSIRTFNKVHLGIAVDTSRGLMVPVIRNADDLSLQELSVHLKKVADSCRKGNIDPELIQSSTASFTISNLGNYGVEMFTPVINLPQTAILGVCTIVNRPANLGNNVFGFVPYIGLSLTYDHRAIDGGPATLFLKEIRDQIESFSYQLT